jgi:hypothetical protein
MHVPVSLFKTCRNALQYTFASLLLKENAYFWYITENISPRRRVIVVATCFLGRLNLILARTLYILIEKEQSDLCML